MFTLISSADPLQIEDLMTKLTEAGIPYEVEEREVDSPFSRDVSWFLLNINEADKEAAEKILHEEKTLDNVIFDTPEEAEVGQKAGTKNLLIGSALVIVGCGITYYSFMSRSDYGIVTYGAILVGLGYLLKGAVQMWRGEK